MGRAWGLEAGSEGVAMGPGPGRPWSGWGLPPRLAWPRPSPSVAAAGSQLRAGVSARLIPPDARERALCRAQGGLPARPTPGPAEPAWGGAVGQPCPRDAPLAPASSLRAPGVPVETLTPCKLCLHIPNELTFRGTSVGTSVDPSRGHSSTPASPARARTGAEKGARPGILVGPQAAACAGPPARRFHEVWPPLPARPGGNRHTLLLLWLPGSRTNWVHRNRVASSAACAASP